MQCAPILQFFFAATVDATAERQIQNRIFGQFLLIVHRFGIHLLEDHIVEWFRQR